MGRRIEELALPAGARIGAIVRRKPADQDGPAEAFEDQVIMAHHDTVIEPEDHVIVFVSNKRLLPRVERLFQVGLGFF